MTKLPMRTLGAVTLVAMTGCSGYGQPAGGAPAPNAQGNAAAAPVVVCNAQPAQSMVGQNSTATVVESARVRSGAQLARILRPGQIITKEFDPQRLNLDVDANGRILAVRCG
ncbi:I78 family peptidase inhibitor [Acidovorax radicis]|uniref:I78 family peptidase inhibitor n=1 Tax=Acidovorax radicis TaxID=758826 RepID=UPI001CF85609|nr:I78 family peptidase inhibitor [Acidovorax radicis]UCU98364.1 proteinase inhibitor I78 [Acidovorax radicis]